VLNKSELETMHIYQIPKDYISKNMFIEVSSQHSKIFENYFSNSLNVSITENIGEIKVMDSELKILKKVYVKCFSRLKNGTVSFYKDGYTDLRGRFNYVSLNTDTLKDVEKFSILVVDDVHGSFMKECNPPANISGSSSGESALVGLDGYRQQIKSLWRAKNKK
jgi:hypothetical protein